MLEGPSADSEEKHEPVSDIDTAPMEGLKALDPKRPIREADMCGATSDVRFGPKADIAIYSITSSIPDQPSKPLSTKIRSNYKS